MPRRTVLATALLAALLIGTAAPTAAPAAPPGNHCEPYSAQPCLLPFPDDRHTVRDRSTPTGRRLALPAKAMPVNVDDERMSPREYNRSDGFSPGTAIVVRVPNLTTEQGIRRNRLVGLEDLSRAYARRQRVLLLDARTGRRQLIWAELDLSATGVERNLLIHPAKNLPEGRRFVVVLRDLVGDDGKRLRRAPWYRRALGQPRQRARFRGIARTLTRANVAPFDVWAAWDFTVASRRDRSARLLRIRDDAFARLGDRDLADRRVTGRSPTLTVDEVITNPEDDPRMLREVKGTLTVPCYLDRPGCPPGARFNYTSRDPDALPVARRGNLQRTPFVCMVPRTAQARPARIALYGHGLLGQPTEVEAGNVRDMAHEHNFVFCATPWSGMASEDISNAIAILENLDRFPSLADRLQQGMLNATFLGRAMLHPRGLAAQAAFRDVRLDRSELFYDGNSQGGIAGGALTAIAPDFRRAVLGVTGMNYGGLLLQRSVDFDTYFAVLRGKYTDKSLYPLYYGLIQQLWDRGEANGYAQHMTDRPLPDTPAHTVLLHIGWGDHQVTNWSADVEARTIGARARRPVLDPGRSNQRRALFGVPTVPRYPYRGSGIVYWDNGPAVTPNPPLGNLPPRDGRDPHEDVRSTPLARVQKSMFLRRNGVLIDPCGRGACHTLRYGQPPPPDR